MKKAYLSISFHNRKKMGGEIETIRKVSADFQTELFVFVDAYHFLSGEEKQMMQKAFAEIDTAGLLIAEVSDKAIGVGIEIGYAVAKNKPIIYLRHSEAEHSTTAAGSADHVIIYRDSEELAKKLSDVLSIVLR